MANLSKPPTLNDDQRAVDIYRKAALIIREKGFGATSMGDIAEAVDLTKGGLYYYIKGKEALLFAIMCFAIDRLEKRVLLPATEIEDPVKRVAWIISGHLGVVLDEPSAMIILADEEEALEAVHRQKIVERKARYVSFVRDSLATLSEERDLDSDSNPEVAAQSLLAMLEGAVRWYDPDQWSVPREAVERQIALMALRSLEPSEAENLTAVA